MSKKTGTELRYGTAEEAGMSQERLDIAKQLTKKWVDQDILNSAVMLVARHGVIVLHEAFGKITYEPDSPPAELDTLYSMSSLGKPVLATALICLVEDGLIGLADPIVDYIPEFIGEGKDKVLAKHLLTHTSGILDEDAFEYMRDKKENALPYVDTTQDFQLQEFLSRAYGVPLSYTTGKEMRYANLNYWIIGEIVRRLSSKSIENFIKERIFDRLGMKESYWGTPDEVINRVAKRSMKEMNRIPLHFTTTTMDMAILMQTFLNKGIYGENRILCPSSVYEMTHNQIPGVPAKYRDEYFPEANWSYGWAMARGWFDGGVMHSPKAFGHGGYGHSYLWGDPEYDLVGAFFATSNNTERIYREHGLFVNVIMSAIDE